MNTIERIHCTWQGKRPDHVPLTTWCFGLPVPKPLRWKNEGGEVRYWYSKRLEHLHTLPFPWGLQDDFNRALAWRSLGVDDILDVSVPWSADPRVEWRDSRRPAGRDEQYPVLVREYTHAEGRASSRGSADRRGPGGGMGDPARNGSSPRGLQHPAGGPPRCERARGRGAAGLLLQAARRRGPVLVCRAHGPGEQVPRRKRGSRSRRGRASAWMPWSGSAAPRGRSCSPWISPKEFGELFEAITETDVARTELAAAHPGIDLVVERGWYSSTNFWSPALFQQFTLPHVRALAQAAHRFGKKFAYVMTTGVEVLGPRARGGRCRCPVLRGPAGPGPEGTFAGEGAGPALRRP